MSLTGEQMDPEDCTHCSCHDPQPTQHRQITLRMKDQEVEVDFNLAVLLTLIWAAGWETDYSCEGWPIENGKVPPKGEHPQGYISFLHAAEAYSFCKAMADGLGFDDYYIHGARFSMVMGTEGRAAVDFNHEMIPHAVRAMEMLGRGAHSIGPHDVRQ